MLIIHMRPVFSLPLPRDLVHSHSSVYLSAWHIIDNFDSIVWLLRNETKSRSLLQSNRSSVSLVHLSGLLSE